MRLTKLFLLLLLLLPAGVANANTESPDTIALQRVESHKNQKVRGEHMVEFNFVGDLPESSDTIYRNVLGWVDNLLTLNPETEQTGEELLSAKEMVAKHQKAFIKDSKADIIEMCKYMEEEDNAPRLSFSYDITISVAHETKKYITFRAETYFYTGGAHGGQAFAYATFQKDNGALLTWDDLFLQNKKSTLSSLIVFGLQKYFGVPSYADMKERLIIDQEYTRNTFPLPAGNPGLLSDGVRVQYASYEIAPYAAGSPMTTIPYAKLRGCWTQKALNLLK